MDFFDKFEKIIGLFGLYHGLYKSGELLHYNVHYISSCIKMLELPESVCNRYLKRGFESLYKTKGIFETEKITNLPYSILNYCDYFDNCEGLLKLKEIFRKSHETKMKNNKKKVRHKKANRKRTSSMLIRK